MPSGDRDRASRQRGGTILVVGGDHNGGTSTDDLGDDLVEKVAAGRIQTRMWFVQQPQLRLPRDQHGERHPAPLTSAEPSRGDVGEAARQPQPVESWSDPVDLAAGRPNGEGDVLLDGEVVVEEASVAEQSEPAPDGPAVVAEVAAEDHGLAAGDGQEPRAGAQDRGLAGAVRSFEVHDLPYADVEIDAGEGREATEQDDGRAEVYGQGRHDAEPMLRAGPPKEPSRRRVMAATGRTMVGAGLLILAFVVYQLWGTGLAESRSQDSLRSAFTDKAAQVRVASAGLPRGATVPVPPQPEGDAIAILRIPKIGVDKAVVQGVGVEDLKRAPGHYPDTPLPGEPGNSAIAGHRTTYGAPFYRLDELEKGDPIVVTTLRGTFRYEVRTTQVVLPQQVEVLNASPDNRLTLTTCEPRFSAAKRLIVVAELVDTPAAPAEPAVPDQGPQPAEPGAVATLDSGLSGEPASPMPAFIWGADAAVLAFGIWRLSKRWRRWPAYVLGSPAFLLLLYLFFENFSRLLPANY